MKFIHLADLHIGKRVNGFSMLEDQRHILQEILGIVDDEKPDAVLIAGDVYDKPIPAEEAVDLFDEFLVDLSTKGLQVFIISGNHDSASRVAFGGRLMDRSGIHFAPVYGGEIQPQMLEDEFGTVCIWPLPFVKPAHVRRFHEEEEIADFNDAMQVVIDHLSMDPDRRNIAIAHQFITGGFRSDSEEVSVGGLDDIAAEVYDPFDYVALGHLHGPQHIGRETVRYAGSPLKYSFSEANQHKSVTIVQMGAKGDVTIRETDLHPLRDMVRIRGEFQELLSRPETCTDYCELTLTDEGDVAEAMSQLRVKYPNVMTLQYDNTRTRSQATISAATNIEKKSPMELFGELYQLQNNQPLGEEQQSILSRLISKIWEEEA